MFKYLNFYSLKHVFRFANIKVQTFHFVNGCGVFNSLKFTYRNAKEC